MKYQPKDASVLTNSLSLKRHSLTFPPTNNKLKLFFLKIQRKPKISSTPRAKDEHLMVFIITNSKKRTKTPPFLLTLVHNFNQKKDNITPKRITQAKSNPKKKNRSKVNFHGSRQGYFQIYNNLVLIQTAMHK